MIDVSRAVALPSGVVWRLLTDTAAWHVWGPTVTGVDSPERHIGPGTRGRVRTLGGLWLPFEVTSFEPGHRWGWRVAGVPATGHRVRPAPDGSTVTFEVPRWAAPYAAVCWHAAGRLTAAAEILDAG